MKEKKCHIAGMLFHPPNLSTVDETILKLFPYLKLSYPFISSINKKRILLHAPSFKLFHLDNIFPKTSLRVGLVGLMLPMLPEQIVSEDKKIIQEKIIRLIYKAHRIGVKLVTLGSFTSIITDQGKDIVNKVPISITSGNTYTAALCLKSIFKVCDKVGINIDTIKLGIIGATGDIGSICSRILARHVKNVILCSRGIEKETKFISEIRKNAKEEPLIFSNAGEAAKKSDIIICATSSFNVLFHSNDVKPGTIICDLSVPPNVGSNIINSRKDIIVFEGGRASIPSYDSISNETWKTLFPYNSVYGCLAEALVLICAKRIENYSIGRGTITEDKINEIYNLGLKYGFDIADFTYLNYAYTDKDFQNIREIRSNHVDNC